MKKERVGFYFVLPWLIGFIIFTALPIIAAVFISLTDWNIVGTEINFVGLENYKQIFNSEEFFHSLWITVSFAILAIPLTIATSFTISIL